MKDLKELEKKGDYLTLITKVRELIAEDRRNLTDPYIKEWCGRRWRNLFLAEAILDKNALKKATKKNPFSKDKRSNRKKISERFLKGENKIEEWDLEMPEAQNASSKNSTLVFSPGLLTGTLPVREFGKELPALEEEHGWSVRRVDAHPLRSCKGNMVDWLNVLEKGLGTDAQANRVPEGKPRPVSKDVVLMGYSKGMPDILTLMVHHPELKDRVKAIISLAGAIGGSYTADEIYRFMQSLNMDLDPRAIDQVLHLFNPAIKNTDSMLARLGDFDLKGALRDLNTGVREAFISEHEDELDELNVPIFTLSASTTALEVPYFQLKDYMTLSRYDANNDMQVTQAHQKLPIPMSTHLATLHGHHWDVAFGPFPKSFTLGAPNMDHPFPKKAMLVANFQLLCELGLID